MNNYDNVSCHSIEEFESDLKRISYIKKLIRKQLDGEKVNTNLLLNHLIVLFNIFDHFATDILLFKINDTESRNILLTYLLFLGRLQDSIPEYGIDITNIKFNQEIIDTLRRL